MTVSRLSVLITGANRGLGLGLVKQFLAVRNVKYILACARNLDNAKDLRELSKTDSRIHCLSLDVTNDNSISDAKDKMEKIIGNGTALNILINNAGIKLPNGGSLAGIDRNVFNDHFNTNIISAIKVSQAFLPYLKIAAKQAKTSEVRASIINMSTTFASMSGKPHGSRLIENSAYLFSKTALNQYTRTLAEDLRNDRIAVVSLCPGWVRTDMGGKGAQLEVNDSAKGIIQTILTLNENNSGQFIRYNGKTIPF